MINVIIPSFNRACQLDLLLRSLNKYWITDKLFVYVLCKYSNSFFKEGYNKLFDKETTIENEYSCSKITIFPILQSKDFGIDIKDIIDGIKENTVGFFTDDCVMFRRTPLSPEMIEFLLKDPKIFSISL